MSTANITPISREEQDKGFYCTKLIFLDHDYIKPQTPEEYKKIKYKGKQRPRSIEDSSYADTSQDQENSKSMTKKSENEEQALPVLPQSSTVKYFIF